MQKLEQHLISMQRVLLYTYIVNMPHSKHRYWLNPVITVLSGLRGLVSRV